MEELYSVRSKVAHKGHTSSRRWGWTVGEHLVMAAQVLPLTVKLLLAREGHYTVTDNDRARGLAVDPLLALTQWVRDRDYGNRDDAGQSWHETMSRVRGKVAFEKAWESAKEKHSDVFPADPAGKTEP